VTYPTDELILVDGPGAGKRVRIDRDWACSYVHTSWPDADRLMQSYDPLGNTTFVGPTQTVYRIGHAYNLDRQVIGVGWCSGESQPDPEQLEYWIRFEPQVKVIAGADAWPSDCDLALQTHNVDATIQGVCRCSWKTEAVPKRRARDVTELAHAHRRVGLALTFGKDAGLLGLDCALLGTYSIGEATRFEALMSRAATLGMSRDRAREIFHDAELTAYGFDEAIERLRHRVRLFEMYGYLPVTARDVLAWRDIEVRQIDPEMILNKPRWMPDPLGRQFAEMRRGRQRILVQAAIEVTVQLGGDAEGWPLERAVAAVMPCKESA
jgi:hypothetical protein